MTAITKLLLPLLTILLLSCSSMRQGEAVTETAPASSAQAAQAPQPETGAAEAVTPTAAPEAGNVAVPSGPARIPLCPGLTIVTAVSQSDGDYESIKTIETVTDQNVRLKYSAERLKQDWLSNEAPTLQRLTMYRTMRAEDLKSANLYLQQFYDKLPETIPGTTAIGTSADVLTALKTKGEAEIGIFIAFSSDELSLDREMHPNVYDNQMIAKIERVGTAPVMLPVIVNDVRTELPTIQARGDFFGDQAEFFFLDDPTNPIALKYRIGIGAIKPVDAETAKMFGTKVSPGGDRDVLQVVKISYQCAAPIAAQTATTGTGSQMPASGTMTSAGAALEQSLTQTGKAEVYDIHFSFNSDQLREESEPTLRAIAAILNQHADWRLSIEGHTDNVASDNYNLELSRKRAAAVKAALVSRYSIEAGRLTTAGYGEARPKDTNDTLEGRARNRRVELIRQK